MENLLHKEKQFSLLWAVYRGKVNIWEKLMVKKGSLVMFVYRERFILVSSLSFWYGRGGHLHKEIYVTFTKGNLCPAFRQVRRGQKATTLPAIFYFWVYHKFLFFNYILLIMVVQLWFFPLCPPLPSSPLSLRQSSYHCSYPWVIHISSLATSILHFTSSWLFCNYLFLLFNPLSSSPIPPHPPPIWKP